MYCRDKTGTLTEARIKLVREVDLTGQESAAIVQMALLNAAFETGLKSPLDEAILAVGKLDLAAWRKIDEVPFDFERRRVSVLVEGGGRRLLVVKGAPEDVLGIRHVTSSREPAAPFEPGTQNRRNHVARPRGRRLSGLAGRVARGRIGPGKGEYRRRERPDLRGFLAFLDPPKAGAREALAALAKLGIVLKVVTGDNEQVTRHVCSELGLGIAGRLTGPESRPLPKRPC